MRRDTAAADPSGWVSLLHSRLTAEICHVTSDSQSDAAVWGFHVWGCINNLMTHYGMLLEINMARRFKIWLHEELPNQIIFNT